MQPPPIPNASPRELNTWFQERLQHAKQPAHGSRTVDRSSLFRTRSAMDVRSLAMRSRRWRVGVAGGCGGESASALELLQHLLTDESYPRARGREQLVPRHPGLHVRLGWCRLLCDVGEGRALGGDDLCQRLRA